MAFGNHYLGNPLKNNCTDLIVALIAIGLSLAIFGFQVGCWVALALTGLRLFNVGKEIQ